MLYICTIKVTYLGALGIVSPRLSWFSWKYQWGVRRIEMTFNGMMWHENACYCASLYKISIAIYIDSYHFWNINRLHTGRFMLYISTIEVTYLDDVCYASPHLAWLGWESMWFRWIEMACHGTMCPKGMLLFIVIQNICRTYICRTTKYLIAHKH